ncbi:unnamed protein product [Rotaria socialis]|uniref:tRNA (32-2'-O)-methyltransferase regulator THADA n=1 Tax=Rotaria socialis TaxID=392032 RepID=A0A818P129_9BILA|nr:unnamed protein product [Rotaria socialis]CAF3696792.1 unnamed protein product [Rotaria socialis]CAF4560342.1 unnamed protein product [Rotaria socialis]CAF4596078.1 unnamed protein product [Rotaria socialis]
MAFYFRSAFCNREVTNINDDLRIRTLFDRILQLLSSTQPPETASGATLVQCIAQINITNLPELINCDIKQEYDQIYLLINHITKRLDSEVQHAKINLLQAAKNGPMYGCLSGINALLTIIHHDKYNNQKQINEWRIVFDHLIKICLEIASITGPIVSSSSPEGMMPMELTDISGKDEDESSNGQITSQMLLVCCWRTIKEISLLFSRLGQIGIKYIQNENQYRFINLKQVHIICNYYMEQLLKSRHCGAYELAYTGFLIICEQLWSSNCDELCNLPIKWIENGIKMVQENNLDKNKLCLTRRSGGLPFYLQSILTDEPIKQRGQQRTYVAKLMETLLNIIQNDPDTIQIDGQVLENSRKIHAYNTVRSFYRNQRFANDVFPYIERGLHLSITGFTSSIWMIRNSATLLLSTIVQRIFGPSKTKDGEENLSKKNSMTSREFFNKYPSLFHLFYQQLQQTTSTRSSIESLSSSCLFAILLILRRLYPSPLDGIDCSLTLDKLLPFVIKCEESPLLRIREHSSKALLALIHHDQYSTIINQQISQLMKQPKDKIRQNSLHGRLLQINAIFESMKKNNLQFTFDSSFNLQDMLSSLEWCIYQNNCSLTQCCYLELLYNIHCQIASNDLTNSITHYMSNILKTADKVTIGSDDLTRILTRLIIRLENVQVQFKLFMFVEQTRTELSFVETLVLENHLSLFENNLRQWVTDLLLTMDLFNEQLYTKACELLLKINDKTHNYERLTRRIVELIEKLRRPMSLAASFNLISELLPLCSSSKNNDEDLIKLVYDRMNDFVNGESNDECACAILNLLSKARSCLYNSCNAERKCQYWGLILKLSSFPSDAVRETFIKVTPLIIDDQRLSGVFGANCYLTQNILFEYFTCDALLYSTSDLFVNLVVNLFIDLLREINSSDEDEEEISLDRRLWPSSEGYNNVFVTQNESCDHYCACYGKHLLSALKRILGKSSQVNIDKTIAMIRDQCNRLIDIQTEAYNRFLIRQRSTVRLNLMIEFLRITHSLQGIQLEKLPQQWTSHY